MVYLCERFGKQCGFGILLMDLRDVASMLHAGGSEEYLIGGIIFVSEAGVEYTDLYRIYRIS